MNKVIEVKRGFLILILAVIILRTGTQTLSHFILEEKLAGEVYVFGILSFELVALFGLRKLFDNVFLIMFLNFTIGEVFYSFYKLFTNPYDFQLLDYFSYLCGISFIIFNYVYNVICKRVD